MNMIKWLQHNYTKPTNRINTTITRIIKNWIDTINRKIKTIAIIATNTTITRNK